MNTEKILMSEVATLYYKENLTQQEIAETLHLSRQTVSKLLSDAIEEKIVEIIIHNPEKDCKELEKALPKAMMDLKPARIPDEPVEFELVTLDRDEKDNSKWLSYVTAALDGAKTFEIHCWNEETAWIELALRYGKLKEDDWKYGKIVTGDVTPEFVQMLLGQPKPADVEIYNKMTPFFNVFLDDRFQSCHYGTELYI